MNHNSESDDDTFTSRDFCAGSQDDLSEDDYSFDSENSVDFSFASTDGEEYDSEEDDPIEPADDDDAAPQPQNNAQDLPQDSPRNDNQPKQINSTDDDGEPPVPAGKSLAHFAISSGEAFYASFDIETAGEYGGICQISMELFSINWETTPPTISRCPETFDRYVNPGENAIWDDNLTRIHGLHPADPRIISAQNIYHVWAELNHFIGRHVPPNFPIILVAYAGESCDLRWIWKLTQAPRSTLSLHPQLKFFLDPYKVVSEYKTCPFHPSKSKLEKLELGAVWKHLMGQNLNGAHNSLVDVKAQTDIVTSQQFLPFIDRCKSIRPMDELFSRATQRQMAKELEPSRPVHEPWVEFDEHNTLDWERRRDDTYNGSQAGGRCGPSNGAEAAAKEGGLVSLFFFIFPIKIFEGIAIATERYAYKEWVIPKPRRDKDGNITKRPIFVPWICRGQRDKRPAEARHRADCSEFKPKVTIEYVLAWIGILILSGAYFGGKNNRGINNIYRNAPYGVSVPFIQNSMPRNAFDFMRRYIHFVDNRDRRKDGEPGYDPLFKVRPVLDAVMDGLRRAWVAGEKITIDESMIKYSGRAVSYVQYMPKKPIKHGIKVFAVCCAVSACLLGFEIYTACKTVDQTAIAVVKRLITTAGLTSARGRILFTDNWYTSVQLATMLYDEYGWRFCGTITPTEKLSRQDSDVPFAKLSKGGLNSVPCGWMREAGLKQQTRSGAAYWLQCTTWKDRKQVMFLHTTDIGSSRGKYSVRRSKRGVRGRETIPAPASQQTYIESFSAVDRNDRDSSHFTTSILTNQLQISTQQQLNLLRKKLGTTRHLREGGCWTYR